jgi:hypothetical protein
MPKPRARRQKDQHQAPAETPPTVVPAAPGLWERLTTPPKKRKARSGQRHQTSQLEKLRKEGL